jgi:hypothetical protein
MKKKREMTEERRKIVAAALKKRRTETLPARGLKEFVVVCPVSRVDELRALARRLVAEEVAKKQSGNDRAAESLDCQSQATTR